jgi:hypothetical protein
MKTKALFQRANPKQQNNHKAFSISDKYIYWPEGHGFSDKAPV